MMARLLVYVYRAYACATVTAQAFNYVRASTYRRPAGLIYVHLNIVSAQKCRDKNWWYLYYSH